MRDPAVLRNVVTGCNLSNNIEMPKHFSQIFSSFLWYFWYLMNAKNGMCILEFRSIWVRSRNCGCLVTWFCYQLIAKPGNKTATVLLPHPYMNIQCHHYSMQKLFHILVGAFKTDFYCWTPRPCSPVKPSINPWKSCVSTHGTRCLLWSRTRPPNMKLSWHANVFHITGTLWEETISHWCIPLQNWQ